MHAHEAFGLRQRGSEPGHRNGRRVGGDDAAGLRQDFQFFQNLLLQLQVLGCSFNQKVGIGKPGQICCCRDMRQDFLFLFLGAFAALDCTVKAGGNGSQPFLQRGIADVAHDDPQSGCRADLCDAGAHLSGTDDSHCLNLHACPWGCCFANGPAGLPIVDRMAFRGRLQACMVRMPVRSVHGVLPLLIVVSLNASSARRCGCFAPVPCTVHRSTRRRRRGGWPIWG